MLYTYSVYNIYIYTHYTKQYTYVYCTHRAYTYMSVHRYGLCIVSSSSQKWSEVEATHSFPQQVFPTPPRVTPTSFCGSNSTARGAPPGGDGEKGMQTCALRGRQGGGELEALGSTGPLYNSKTIESAAPVTYPCMRAHVWLYESTMANWKNKKKIGVLLGLGKSWEYLSAFYMYDLSQVCQFNETESVTAISVQSVLSYQLIFVRIP